MQSIRTYVSFDSGTRVVSQKTCLFFIVLNTKYVQIDNVDWIDAFNRDALTHDEVFVRFHADGGGLVISEFDQGFSDVIAALTPIFPGIEGWNGVTPDTALTEASLILWTKTGALDPEDISRLK